MMIRQRKPLEFWDYVTIGGAAAVCAFTVMGLALFIGVPMLCPEGVSAASCPLKPGKQTAMAVASAPAAIEKSVTASAPQAAADLLPEAPPTGETQVAEARAEADDGAVPTRKVKALVVKPRSDGSTTILGLSATPEPPAAVAAIEAVDVEETASIVAPTPLPSDRRPAEPDTLTVTTGANVRSGPTRGAKTIFSLAAGEEVHEIKKQKGWVQVRDDQDRTGWIYSDFVD